MIRDNQEFEVELIVTTRHLYTVHARTPEEAISDAEGLLEDGESGEVMSRDIEASDAYPIEESVDYENPDEEEGEDEDGD